MTYRVSTNFHSFIELLPFHENIPSKTKDSFQSKILEYRSIKDGNYPTQSRSPTLYAL